MANASAKGFLANYELEDKQEKNVVVPRSAAEIQRFKLEKLLKKADKPVFIPEKKDPKLPRVFNPPEFIRNIWGSSAGAGSGDFHVYRGVRRRENARQKYLNQKYKQDDLDEEFQKKLTEHKKAAVSRTEKKRAKRLKKKQKAKEGKKKKIAAKPNTDDGKGNDGDSDENSDASADDADFSATVDSGRNDSADTKTADVLVTDNMEEDGKCIERTDDDSDGDR